MGAVWRRAWRTPGRRRIVDECCQDGGVGCEVDIVEDDDEHDCADGVVAAPVASAGRRERSSIRWDTKFHAHQAYKLMSGEGAPDARESDMERSPVGGSDAISPVVMRKEPSRLRWHFFSNLLLSLMVEGINVQSLPEIIDERYLRQLMRGRFQKEQHVAACGSNGSITRDQVWEFIPPDMVYPHHNFM